MSNNNQELLDWAVENIKEWDDGFTHLRGGTDNISYTAGSSWTVYDIIFPNWILRGKPAPDTKFKMLKTAWWGGIIFTTAQVITKQEWLEAKKEKENMSNEFNLKDLKTGMIVETRECDCYLVLLDTVKGDVLVSMSNDGEFKKGFVFLSEYSDNLTLKDGWHQGVFDITKVFQTQVNDHDLFKKQRYTTIWERPAKETPEQAKQRELREQYETTKKQLEELGKQLGIE